MRALWVDAGNDANWTKAHANGITALYYPMSDSSSDVQRRLIDSRNRGFASGVYMAWNWPGYSTTDGALLAEQVHKRVGEIVKYPKPAWPKVQFDLEDHNPEFIVKALNRWRELRPYQDTSWTMEPFQIGWVTQELVNTLLKNRIRVVPQYYFGDMTPVAQDRVFAEWVLAGVPVAQISGFYDAARLPSRWDGFAFTQGRLP